MTQADALAEEPHIDGPGLLFRDPAEHRVGGVRASSTLVNVSSVRRRPATSVLSPLFVARSGTPKPAVQIVTMLGNEWPSRSVTASRVTRVTFASGPSSTVTPSLASPLAIERRTRGCKFGRATALGRVLQNALWDIGDGDTALDSAQIAIAEALMRRAP
jgi:hypothetical protein